MVSFRNSAQKSRQLRNLTDNLLHNIISKHKVQSLFQLKNQLLEIKDNFIVNNFRSKCNQAIDSIVIIQILNSKKKMARNKQTLKVKIGEFEQANVNFRTKLQQLYFYLKLYPLQLIQEHIAKPSSLLIKIKWLILFNYIIIDDGLNSLELISDLIAQLNISPHTDLSSIDKLMYEKLFNPYKFYLQKRQFFNYSKHTKQNSTYQLINLIRNALSFTDVLFTIGRYLFKKNYFLVEFNIVVGRDLANLYKRVRMQLNEEQKMLNAQIIEKMNEGLYNIYYNCYFSQYTARLAPIWINTEDIFKKISEKKLIAKNTYYKEVQQTIIIDNQISIYDTFVKGLQECEEPKSASTIESHTDKQNDGYMSSRLQFINLASNLLLQMKKIESAKNLIH